MKQTLLGFPSNKGGKQGPDPRRYKNANPPRAVTLDKSWHASRPWCGCENWGSCACLHFCERHGWHSADSSWDYQGMPTEGAVDWELLSPHWPQQGRSSLQSDSSWSTKAEVAWPTAPAQIPVTVLERHYSTCGTIPSVSFLFSHAGACRPRDAVRRPADARGHCV